MKIRNLFKNLKKNNLEKISEYESIDGWLSPNEAMGLYLVSKKVKSNGIALEIGSWKGKSTYCIAMGLKSSTLFAIDPFNGDGDLGSIDEYKKKKGEGSLFDQFKSNMKRLGVFNKINPLVGYSKDFVGKIDSIDFLFIDGDHSKKECEFDFVNYSPKVKKRWVYRFS